jgi:hypothetical protein
MSGDLDAVRLKLHRAQIHLEALHAAVQAFHWRDAYDARVELDAQANELVVIAIVRENPPREWAPLFGDLIHNLRSALDHLAIALVLSTMPTANTRTNAFPIFDEDPYRPKAPKSDKDTWKKLVKGMSAEQVAAVREVQPFNTPIPASMVNTLTVIGTLSNTDKHRTLIPIGGAAGGAVELDPRKLDGWKLNARIAAPPMGKIEHGTVIARFGLTPLVPNPDMDVDVGVRFGVSVTLDEGVPPGTSIDTVLRASYTRVLDIVNDFEARFFV